MITGDGIRFRAPEKKDLLMFAEWLNDPEVRDGILVSLPMSIANEEMWFESMIERPTRLQPFTIEVEDEGKWFPIGNCGFHGFDDADQSADIGIMIGNKKFRDKGYGTQAMELLLKVGFDIHNLHRISLDVYATNLRAKRVYEKVGFVEEARKRQGMYKNGEYVDVFIMSILRSEWEAKE